MHFLEDGETFPQIRNFRTIRVQKKPFSGEDSSGPEEVISEDTVSDYRLTYLRTSVT